MDVAMNRIKTGRQFSRRLRLYRSQKGISMETLAREVGVTRQAIGKIEQGGGASLDLAAKLARALEVSLDLMVAP